MGEAVTPLRPLSPDTEAIVAWKAATGLRKELLLAQIFRAKSGLIRQLTMKAARAEKTAETVEDLFQAGCIGFQRALEGFDPYRGLSISTYAAWWIKHEVQRVARRAPVVALPRIRLTNDERSRAVLALRADPDVAPESIGIRRSQLEQVRNSIGVRFISDAVERGARAVERKLLSGAEPFDAEENLDRARRYRAMEHIVARVRGGASADELGLSPDAYAAALEVIRVDQEIPAMPEESTAQEETTKIRRKRPGPKPGFKRVARLPKPPTTFRDQLKTRIAEIEAERKMLETLLSAPADAVERVLTAFAKAA